MKFILHILWPWAWSHEPFWITKPHAWDIERRTLDEI